MTAALDRIASALEELLAIEREKASRRKKPAPVPCTVTDIYERRARQAIEKVRNARARRR
jgi:hypothetical protein